MSAFGPVPIPNTPNAVQASIIGQQAQAPRAREKNKPTETESSRRAAIRDEVRLSDPSEAQPVDSKPDAAEEWKHRRQDGRGSLDIQA